jgi:hypothetical protein
MTTIQEKIIEAFGSAAPPGMKPALNPFVEVITIESFQDFILANVYIGLFYYSLFFIAGGKYLFSQEFLITPILSLKPPKELLQ